MRKFVLRKKVVSVLLAMTVIMGMLPAFAQSGQTDDYEINISGSFQNPMGDEEVTLDVYYPNKSFSDLLSASPNDYNKILLYRDEMTMNKNGGYSFSFNVGNIPSGSYTAYISRSGRDEVKTEVINYISPTDNSKIIVTTQFGNIYYTGDTPVFYIKIPSAFSYRNVELRYKVTTFDGEVMLERTENPTAQSCSVKLNDFNSFGVFDFNVELYANNSMITSDSKSFSMLRSTENKNEKVNIHELFGNDTAYLSYTDKIMSVYDKTGFDGARTGMSRNGVTWNNDALTYQSAYTKMMQYYSNSDIKPMVILSGSNSVWNHMPVTDVEKEDFKKYCVQVAKDTKDYATAYEVWNEPNATGFNKDGATPKQYAELIKIASEAVKSVNPNAKIVAMATSGSDKNWIKNTIDGAKQSGFNIADYIDAVSIHPYYWGAGPRTGLMSDIQSVRNLMNENGLSAKQLWVTEIGWQRIIGLDRQAFYTADYLLLNDVNKAADKTFIFRYAGSPPSDGNEEFGLLNDNADDVPFSARPVMAAVANYNRIMSGAEYVGILTIDGAEVYRFKLADGRDAAVFYSENKDSAINIDLGTSEIVVSDIYGNDKALSSANGKFSLNTTDGVNYAIGNFTKFEKASGTIDNITVSKTALEEDESALLTVVSDKDIEIKGSENVSVSLNSKNGNTSVYSCSVKSFDSNKAFIDVSLKENGKVSVVRRFNLKESYGDDVLYHADRYNYSGYYNWSLYNAFYSSERPYAFWFTANANRVASFSSNEITIPQANAKYKLSFEFMAEDYRKFRCVFANKFGVDSTSNFFPGLTLTEDGKIGYYDDRYYQIWVETDKTYELGRWYKADAIIDFSTGTIEYFIDGEKIGSTSKYPFSTLGGFSLSDSSSSNGAIWVDNIEIRQLNTTPFDISVSGDTFKVTANENTASFFKDNETAAILYAVYDTDNRLTEVNLKKISKSFFESNYGAFLIESDVSYNTKRIKVFLMNDASTLTPLSKAMVKRIG